MVINVIQRDWRHLLDRLDYAQAAPPLFLWAERAMYKCFGAGEYSLRFLPLCSLVPCEPVETTLRLRRRWGHRAPALYDRRRRLISIRRRNGLFA